MMLGEIHKRSRKPHHPIPKKPDYAQVALELQSALQFVDRVATRQRSGYSDETKSSFAHRKYTLADARKDARTAAIALRKAWEIIDPTCEVRREAAFNQGLDAFARAAKKARS